MPIKPILMTPAYRSGEMTPWGGEQLRTLFGKEIPNDQTGESLEVSAIPFLNSRDELGTPLQTLIDEYGKRLLGKNVKEPFPLLLKLLATRDRLSVQVHPDDAYARAKENKLGKTEAWVILACEEDSTLVYGISEGYTREQLLNALQSEGALAPMLRTVRIKPGDCFFIPAGTVHAIGKNIVLYEIQQSSDLTYRLYDWDRRDRLGNKRALHIEKALDVTDTEKRMEPVQPVSLPLENGRLEEMIRCPEFTLHRYTDCENAPIANDERRFALLTAIEEAVLACECGALRLNAGETALLPADGFDIQLTGKHTLVSFPTVSC